VRVELGPGRQTVEFAPQDGRLYIPQLDEVRSRENRRGHCAERDRGSTERLSIERRAFVHAAQQNDEQRRRQQRRVHPQEVARDIRGDIRVRVLDAPGRAERPSLRRR
jgi:hypothetical protein